MKPKEKAEQLWWSYYSAIEHTLSEEYSPHEGAIAKQCASIAVDEILNNNKKIPGIVGIHINENTNYWNEVKQEIEKL